ncbi:MAG: YbaB/EbfC family nucleoid-associated protein [Simkaniaceae bacterium]|nr:YbaB/EbfC family nucleoid-associated protein [Simkaniaceae bacterium]MCF7852118.1 YbaB/EbfC family nucleoid-associated protein [Simkaniaceae bacterium]
MGSGFSKMKKQAKRFEEQFSKFQEELKAKEFEGQAGNGLVKVILNGEKKLKSLTINPECVDKDDIEGLQDLIIGAFADAESKVSDESPNMGGGLPAGLGGLF